MTVTASETYPITYASNGNIANKYDAGQYIYSASPRPYRLMDVYETDTNYNNGVGGKFEYLDYNYFNKATLIELGRSKYSLYYGVDKQRIKSIDSASTQKTVRYYFGSYEKEIVNGSTRHVDYIFAPSGLALIVKTPPSLQVVNGKGAGAGPISLPGPEYFYVTTDNLGSIVLITDTGRNAVSRYYYQPFGGRVLLAGTDITPRGYTFHEHLTLFGLINMNGRFYDPVLARFLSPDPYVQMPDFTQNFNGYAYCMNNPFKFTDPTGEKMQWWGWLLIGLGADIFSGGFLSTTGMLACQTGTLLAGTASSILTVVDFTASLGKGIFTGNWKPMENWAKIEAAKLTGIVSNFYFDKTANGFEWVLQVVNAVTLGAGEQLQTEIGNIFTHALNTGDKIEKTGFLKGRLITRTPENTTKSAISLGYYVTGDQIAMNPCDFSGAYGYDPSDGNDNIGYGGRDLLAHEYGHTYQSKIMGPMYLFRVGISSAAFQGSTENDANRRGFANLNMSPNADSYRDMSASTYKWYELLFSSVLWPSMWSWNN